MMIIKLKFITLKWFIILYYSSYFVTFINRELYEYDELFDHLIWMSNSVDMIAKIKWAYYYNRIMLSQFQLEF